MTIDRNSRVTIYFNGRPVAAFEGQSIAGALYAAGVRTFSRSFKYHRPRGLLCVAGRCPNCMMNVDGVPNVRVCVEPVREGVRVRSQNAFPSLERDVLNVFDKFDRLLPVGFYYKTFIRPRRLWPVYERILRTIAGLGALGAANDAAGHFDREYRHTDVAVIGGGPAGLIAALEAASHGVDVTVVDEQPALGGHLRFREHVYDERPGVKGRTGSEIAGRLAQDVAGCAGIEVFDGATAFGFYEGNLIGVVRGRRLVELRARRTVFATGRFERPIVFENNDLPGVMLGSGALRLLRLDGVRPGQRAVVVAASDEGLALAGELSDAGIAVAAVADLRPAVPATLPAVQKLLEAGVPLLAAHTVTAARGTSRVIGATLAKLDQHGDPVPGSEIRIECDLIAVSAGFEVASSLLRQAGCTFNYDHTLDQLTLGEVGPDVYGAGEVTGATALPILLAQGRLAGLRAALDLQPDAPGAADRLAALERELAQLASDSASRQQGRNPRAVARAGRKQFVCVCEDVTEKDVRRAIGEGFDHVETLKRYSTFAMGPCQGKMCSLATLALTARETGQSIDAVGTTTARPPYHPVALGALAGPDHEPVKVTSIHQRHIALGAELMDTGEWKRPRSYASELDEVRGVRESVGIIDVGTLGKLDVRGKDAVKLLEKVYTNRVADLRVGRVRYGVMCDDSGIILDDGTLARLAGDHFFLTTTSTGASAIEEWLTWWAAGTGLCVHVTNVTAGFAAINLAGPRARDVLAKLTTQDLSSRALPYLATRQFEVAGVPTLCLRIGFVGEIGYELHCPAEDGEHLWNALLVAGKGHDIVPFGVEAQRVLRLEKGHIIVTQDTDALSNPLEADMAWAVKLDKPDFVGRPMLQRVQAEGLRNKLIGYEMVEPSMVPEEGCQVIAGGRPAGRVSSSRFSPTLQKSIGMAWVPIDVASPGSLLSIRWNERDVPARVVTLPFYDPEGARLRGGDWKPPAGPPPASAATPPKLSAFHHRLVAAGATLVDVDGWRQAERIGGVENEVRRAREGVGVVDVSPAGKLDLKGTGVAGLLARLCGDAAAPGLHQVGRVDVGGSAVVLARLAEDQALVLTPAGARGGMTDAISGTMGAENDCHHLTDVTSTLAGLRLVGPRCRDLLRKLTSADLRDRVVPTESCAQVGLAKVPALILRLDRTGLPTYELYISRDYGEYLWDVLFDAGGEFGIVPIGLSAGRTLSEEA